MKKSIWIYLVVLLFLFVSCNEEKISLNLIGDNELIVGEVITIKAITNYKGDLIYSSSDDSIVRINNGMIEGIKAGKATITVKAGSVEESIDIIVNNKKEEVEYFISIVEIESSDRNIILDVQTNLPEDKKDFIWLSSNELIASVNNGVVTMNDEGKAIITVKTRDESLSDKIIVFFEKEIKEIVLTNQEIKEMLQITNNDYLNTRVGKISTIISDDKGKIAIDFEYDYSFNNKINSLKWHEEISDNDINIKDITISESKCIFKSTGIVNNTYEYDLTPANEQDIMLLYNPKRLLDDLTRFYYDDLFFSSLELINKTDNVYSFKLDDEKYNGELINDSEEILLTITTNKYKIIKVEYLSKDKKIEIYYK